MIFWILLICSAGFFLLAVGWCALGILANDHDPIAPLVFGGFAALLMGGLPAASWFGHAQDLGTIEAQHEVIAVYQERVNRLTERLDGFDYPRQDAALLLNADSPVRSIVESLTEAEGQLAEAEAERARAIRNIEQRRRGPMSGVITVVGDYR